MQQLLLIAVSIVRLLVSSMASGRFVLGLKGRRLLMIRESASELEVHKAMPLFLLSRVNFSHLQLLQFNKVGEARAGRGGCRADGGSAPKLWWGGLKQILGGKWALRRGCCSW